MTTDTPTQPAAAAASPAAPETSAQPAAPPQTFLGSGSPDPGQSGPTNKSFTPPNVFGGHVDESGQFKEGWTEHVRNSGFETLAGKLQVAKDEKTALKILDDSLKLASRRELKGLPNETWQDYEISEFRRAHGVPDEPAGYQLKPAELPPGIQWDDELGGKFAQVAHANHIPAPAAKAIIDFHLQQVATQAQAGQAAIADNIGKLNAASQAEFSREWGSEYNDRLEANRAFVGSRFSQEELADPLVQTALSHPKIVRFIDEARRALREGGLTGAGQGAAVGSQSPQQQAESIMASNPGWAKDPATAKRVYELQALQSQMNRRRG